MPGSIAGSSYTDHHTVSMTEKGMLSFVNDAVILLDENFTIRYWNEAATKIYGRELTDVDGRFLYDVTRYLFIDSDEVQAVEELKSTGRWEGIVKILHEGGRSIYLETKVCRMTDPGGGPSRFVAVNRDITNEYEATASLANYTSLLNSIEETYIVIDSNRHVVVSHFKAVTSAFYRFTYEVGEHILERIPPNRHAPISAAVDAAFAGMPTTYDVESPLMEGVVLQTNYFPIHSTNGVVTHVCTVVKDVSAERHIMKLRDNQRKAEQRLFETRLLFEDFIQKSPILAWMADSSGKIRFMNAAQQKMLSLTDHDPLTLIVNTFPGSLGEQFSEQSLRTIELGETVDRVFSNDDDDSTQSIKAVIFPISIQGESMAACWSIDVSGQVRTQQQLVKYQQMHQQSLLETMIDAQESERDNVSRLLRDSITQTLASCKVLFELSSDTEHQLLSTANQHLENAIQQIRGISEILDPVSIDQAGLISAIENLAVRSTCSISVVASNKATIDQSLPRVLQLGIYRIIQNILVLLQDRNKPHDYSIRILSNATSVSISIDPWDGVCTKDEYTSRYWSNIIVRIASLNGSHDATNGQLLIVLPLQTPDKHINVHLLSL